MKDFQLILQSESEYFFVFFKYEGSPDHKMRWSGDVWPIYRTGEEEFCYRNDQDNGHELDKTKATCFFDFSYCWRGVWEGRFYPKQEEYWGEDVSILSDLWNQIDVIMKNKIKEDNPEYEHFD